MDITVITPAYERPKHLARTLQAFRDQQHPLRAEHLVVADGPCDKTRFLAGQFGARYIHLPERQGNWGAACLDAGIAEARGDYVCFWDDDNIYYPWALLALFLAAHGRGIGIVQCEWVGMEREIVRLVPDTAEGTPLVPGNVDTMCFCVHRAIARTAPWEDGVEEKGADWRWLRRLVVGGVAAGVHVVPVVIGKHL